MKNRRVRFDKDSKEVERQSTAISSSSEDEIPPAAAPPGVDVSAALSPAQKQKDSGIKDRKIKDGNSEEVWLVRNDFLTILKSPTFCYVCLVSEH